MATPIDLLDVPELKALGDKQQAAQARFKKLLDTDGLTAEAAALGALAEGSEEPVEGPWDAFRKEGMVKRVNAFLKEHGWALVWTMNNETVPMRLPGAPRVARAEDLDADDRKHLERLAKMDVG